MVTNYIRTSHIHSLCSSTCTRDKFFLEFVCNEYMCVCVCVSVSVCVCMCDVGMPVAFSYYPSDPCFLLVEKISGALRTGSTIFELFLTSLHEPVSVLLRGIDPHGQY